MKKAILSVAFIGLFGWFGVFSVEDHFIERDSPYSGTIKRPIEW